MKRIALLLLFLLPVAFNSCKAKNNDSSKSQNTQVLEDGEGEVIYLTNESFKKLIFNYENFTEWKYEGKRPAIIDFYADWCGPCRMVAPIIEELAREYSGKVDIYKVDTEKERILAQNLGISSLPTILFIPSSGTPQAALGAIPKESFVQAINQILLID